METQTLIDLLVAGAAFGGLVLGVVNLWRDSLATRPRLAVGYWPWINGDRQLVGTVEVSNVGRAAASVSRAGFLFADGRAILATDRMGPANVKFPHLLEPGTSIRLDFFLASADREADDTPVVAFAELPTGEIFHARPFRDFHELCADKWLVEKSKRARRKAFPRKFRV